MKEMMMKKKIIIKEKKEEQQRKEDKIAQAASHLQQKLCMPIPHELDQEYQVFSI